MAAAHIPTLNLANLKTATFTPLKSLRLLMGGLNCKDMTGRNYEDEILILRQNFRIKMDEESEVERLFKLDTYEAINRLVEGNIALSEPDALVKMLTDKTPSISFNEIGRQLSTKQHKPNTGFRIGSYNFKSKRK